MPMNVEMPDGTIIQDVPDGTTQAQVAAKYQAHLNASSPAPASKPSPGIIGTAVDMARSIPGGLAQGIAGMAGLPGDMRALLDEGANKVMGYVAPGSQPISTARTPLSAPTSGQLNNLISALTGGYYVPKTSLGNYTQTAASFAPALFGGEASLGKKLVGRVLAPAAGATAAGSLVPDNDPSLKTAAQVGGAVLGGGIVGGARAISGALGDVSPETTANNYLANLLQKTGSTPETIVNNIVANRGQIGAEALGPNGVAAMATLGRRPGTTGEMLANLLSTRSAEAPTRILNDYSTASGISPDAAQGNIDSLVSAGRAQVKPLFDQALSVTPQTPMGSQTGIMTPDLASLMQRPIIKSAMALAATDIRNGGGDPNAIGLMFDEDGKATQVSHPTPVAWDLTKKALGQSVERDAFGNQLPTSKSPGNYNISLANNSLTSALTDAIPGYGDALAQSGDYLSLQSAFNLGQKSILNTGTTAAQVADHLDGMTQPEIDAYKGGIANQLFLKAQNNQLTTRALSTPAVQAKLSVVLGPDNAKKFLTGVQQEIDLAKSGSRMMPGAGSITSDVLLNSADQDMGHGITAGLHAAKAIGNAATLNVPGAIGSGISAARYFFPDMLKAGGTMTPEARNMVGQTLALPPEEMAARLSNLPSQKSPALLARLLGEQ